MSAPYHTDRAAKRLTRNLEARPTTFAATAVSAGAQVLAAQSSRPGAAGTHVVYLTGPRPPEWRHWAHEALPAGWEATDSYYEGAHPILRYQHDDGRRLELHRAAAWYGTGTYGPADAAAAWQVLTDTIGQTFTTRGRNGETVRAGPLATPATTGRDLWLRTIPRGRIYPTLDPETQELLRGTLGQGRVEGPDALLAGRAPDEPLPGLYEYDGRLMYAPLCWQMPTGVPIRDELDTYADEYAQGRYRVTVTIPRDWPHRFGLLGLWDDTGRHWTWPAEPGRTFTAWADGAELRLIAHAGWAPRILERILFPRSTARGPLDTWARRLVDTRDRLRTWCYPDVEPDVLGLVRNAIRQILITTIGAFQGRAHTITRTRPVAEGLDGIPLGRARVEGDCYVWPEEQPAAWPGLAHPEWCAAVWGRARARLLAGPGAAGALNMTEGTHVVAFRTDAIYTTGRQDWPDTGKAGQMRLTRWSTVPVPAPRTHRELLELRARLPHQEGTH